MASSSSGSPSYGSYHSDPPNPKQLAAEMSRRRGAPAWIYSLVLHVAVFIVAGLLVRSVPQGAAKEADRAGGIVLAAHSQTKTEYLSEEDFESTEEASNTTSSAAATLPTADQAPVDLSGVLPSKKNLLGPSGDIGELLPGAGGITPGPKPAQGLGKGAAQTGVFGVVGEGTKFVYVFDRSDSMGGFQGRPLAASKAELIKSIKSLGPVHQFQIIFYNEQPRPLNPFFPQPPRLLYGSEGDLQLANNFIRGMRAQGGTNHIDALRMALRMKPDVIFFLTDADQPQLTYAELEQIQRLNRGVAASINTIEFGSGPFNSTNNFLVRLARQNGGAHVYVDVAKLPLRQDQEN